MNTAAGGNNLANLASTFLPLILLVVIFYFMIMRPQQKKDKLVRDMIASLEVGDKIHTIGGVIGKIIKIKDDEIVIETGSVGNPNERGFLMITKGAIKEVIKQEKA